MCRKMPGIAVGRLCEKCAWTRGRGGDARGRRRIRTRGTDEWTRTREWDAGDGKCVVCDSHVRPATLVRVCDECNYGTNQGRCVICGGVGVSDAYYCKGCTLLEKDRDGCPKIINLGAARTDLFYERKKYGFRPRTE